MCMHISILHIIHSIVYTKAWCKIAHLNKEWTKLSSTYILLYIIQSQATCIVTCLCSTASGSSNYKPATPYNLVIICHTLLFSTKVTDQSTWIIGLYCGATRTTEVVSVTANCSLVSVYTIQLPGAISNGGYFESHTNILGTQHRSLK